MGLGWVGIILNSVHFVLDRLSCKSQCGPVVLGDCGVLHQRAEAEATASEDCMGVG